MAGLLGVTSVANYVPNQQNISYVADSGATALTTNAWALTATFSTVLSVQPTINYVWVYLTIWTLAATITTVDFTMTDGTTTVSIGTVPAPTAASANRGISYGPFAAFNAGKDGGLAVVTGIAAVTANIVNSGTGTATGRLYVLGYP